MRLICDTAVAAARLFRQHVRGTLARMKGSYLLKKQSEALESGNVEKANALGERLAAHQVRQLQ